MPTVASIITKDEFTPEKLREIYQQAYMDPQTDADGTTSVVVDGVKILASVDPGRGVLRLASLFGVKPGVNRIQLLELCNRINDGLILIRATHSAAFPQPALLLDHYLVTDVGVTGEEVIDETRRFRMVIASIPPLDTDQLLT